MARPSARFSCAATRLIEGLSERTLKPTAEALRGGLVSYRRPSGLHSHGYVEIATVVLKTSYFGR